METINRYQHVRRRPGMYGLHDNYFWKIFTESILDLLHKYSFSLLKITTDLKRNQVVFEASERTDFRVAREECWSFIMIAGISSTARFIGEYKDGSVRRTVIKETEEIENAFDFHPDPNLVRLECSFVLPEKYPVHENFAIFKCHQFFWIFSHSRIIYNGYELTKGNARNRITWFLNLRREHDSAPLPIYYEFNGGSDGSSWEVSFDFKHAEKQTFSFIDGIETVRGGTHVDCVTRAIEQAFRQTGNSDDIPFENMALAVSVHLPPGIAINFDSCRCCEDNLKLISEHPEFELMERDLKSQIIKYLSKATARSAK